MTKTRLINDISNQRIIATRNIRKNLWQGIKIQQIPTGILMRDSESIRYYYGEKNKIFVEFDECSDEQLQNYKHAFIDKILSSGHEIETYVYLFPVKYALRDFKMHVWIDYSASQWDEIIHADFAPILYDFDEKTV